MKNPPHPGGFPEIQERTLTDSIVAAAHQVVCRAIQKAEIGSVSGLLQVVKELDVLDLLEANE